MNYPSEMPFKSKLPFNKEVFDVLWDKNRSKDKPWTTVEELIIERYGEYAGLPMEKVKKYDTSARNALRSCIKWALLDLKEPIAISVKYSPQLRGRGRIMAARIAVFPEDERYLLDFCAVRTEHTERTINAMIKIINSYKLIPELDDKIIEKLSGYVTSVLNLAIKLEDVTRLQSGNKKLKR